MNSRNFTSNNIQSVTSWNFICGAASQADAIGTRFVKGELTAEASELLCANVRQTYGFGGPESLTVGELKRLLTEYFPSPTHKQFILGLALRDRIIALNNAPRRQGQSPEGLMDDNGLMNEEAFRDAAERYNHNVHFFFKDAGGNIHPMMDVVSGQSAARQRAIIVPGAQANINVLYNIGMAVKGENTVSAGHFELLASAAEVSEHNAWGRQSNLQQMPITDTLPEAKDKLGRMLKESLNRLRNNNRNPQPSNQSGVSGLGLMAPDSVEQLSVTYQAACDEVLRQLNDPQQNNALSFSGAESKRGDQSKATKWVSYFFPANNGISVKIKEPDQIRLDNLYARQVSAEFNSQTNKPRNK